MLSMPPDSTISAEPALMMSCASMVAFMPEPQTLLTVVAPVASGSLAPRAAWRAGAWPCPAGSTLPMNTSSILSGASFARSSAAPITCEPSLWAAERRELAHEAAERGAGGGKDDDGIGGGHGGAPRDGGQSIDYDHHMMRLQKMQRMIG